CPWEPGKARIGQERRARIREARGAGQGYRLTTHAQSPNRSRGDTVGVARAAGLQRGGQSSPAAGPRRGGVDGGVSVPGARGRRWEQRRDRGGGGGGGPRAGRGRAARPEPGAGG